MAHRFQCGVPGAICALLWTLTIIGCGGGDARPSLIEEAQQDDRLDVKNPEYTKTEGLHLDVPYLMGKRYDDLDPAVIADQLGAEISRQELPNWGEVEIEYGDRTVRLYRDEINYISYRLGHPMDMTTAMGVCGFPLRPPPSLPATVEERIVNYWNMRQISLMRTEPNSDVFDEIRVWKVRPQEVERLGPSQ
jgi:hypothetical protein